MLDTDKDGKISALEVSDFGRRWLKATKEEKMEMLSHFRGILVKVDPYEVMNALTALWTVFVTLLATLRSSFAKDIALGVSLGHTLTKSVAHRIKPLIASTVKVDDEMKPWLDFVVENTCKLIGISIALILVRAVSAFHSAVKGGAILAGLLFKFLRNQELAPNVAPGAVGASLDVESGSFFLGVQYSLAAYGFWYQLSSGFALNSIFLRLILAPFVLLETILTLFAAY